MPENKKKPGPSKPNYGNQSLGAAAAGGALGGLNLGGLADAGRAETGTRLAGQQSLVDAYLDSNLGMQQAGFQADSERDQRLAQIRRNMALLEETVANQRAGQQAALQRERIRSSADDAAAERAFREQMAREDLIAELGALSSLQEPVGEDPGFGRDEVHYDRGVQLSPREADEIRSQVFERGDSGRSNWKIGGVVPTPFGGRSGKDAITYDTQYEQARGLYDQFLSDQAMQANPMAFVASIRKLFHNDPDAASLALRDLGANIWAPQG